MKKMLLVPAFIICLLLGVQSHAQGSGFSMAVLMDDVIVLAKFDSASFTMAEADSLSQMVAELLTANVTDAHVFFHHDLGNPDALRAVLQDPAFFNLFQIFFLDVSKAANPAGAQNIWIDLWYENEGLYLATLGFPEEFIHTLPDVDLFR